MPDLPSVISGLKRRYFRRDFDLHCKAVFGTPPVELDESSGPVVLSQSFHPDLLMYLVATKTFARFIRPAKFVVVDDGYTSDDQAIIRKHLRKVDFVPRKSVRASNCPVGGCWERLLSVADFCADYYVIQLDSDTVTVEDPTEVREYISNHVSFTLSTKLGRDFISVSEAAAAMKSNDSQHIQVLAERALGLMPELSDKSYIRGCAGFAGFARGSINRTDVEHLSNLMGAYLGSELWRQWGSEQFASNYLIANTLVHGLLPYDSYPYWEPRLDINEARLIHFIGDNRFTSSGYRKIAIDAIKKLGLA